MGINIPEILVANGTGIGIVAFLLFFRVRKQQKFVQIHEQIFSVMMVFALIAMTGETLSFLIDGRKFHGCYFLQYLSNTVCLGLVVIEGFLWCLFVDYRIYCNKKRLKYKAAILSLPMLPILVLLIVGLFGKGLIFTVGRDNCYHRGSLSILTYIVLFIYFAESISNAQNAQKKGVTPFFFPIYCFVVPCIVGSLVQGFCYGISTGWLSTAVATVFVYLELQTANYYMDGLSGLFNRQYMNYYLEQKSQRGIRIHGIVLDINDFKSINDVYGHTVGDRAIGAMGKIISRSVFQNAVAMRVGGDEFVVFLSNSSDMECRQQMNAIQKSIEGFNKNENEIFCLSASMGSDRFYGQSVENFLTAMDADMYEAKRNYHKDKQMQSR